jgi:type II secretory pathway pseudopilin PulG
MRRIREEAGVTVTELLVAIGLTSALLAASLFVFAALSNQKRRVDSQGEAQDTARMAIDRIASQVRSATGGDAAGSQPTEKVTSYDLVYLAPAASPNLANNARGVEHVRYCLDVTTPANETLWLQTAPYDTGSNSSSPSTSSCPSSSWPNQRRVAEHLVNQLASSPPLFISRTDSSGNVTDIAIRALVDVNTSAAPPATQLQSSITLRNFNRAPTASMSCQASSNGHAICDASASIDPDGENLTFAWQMDGTQLSQTSYRLDQSSLASRSNHTFTVTVTDPGGKNASATQSVTMP